MNNLPFAEGAGYVRGRFVPIAEATLPVTDWGFTRSDVVYDVVHVFKGGFFRLADHLEVMAWRPQMSSAYFYRNVRVPQKGSSRHRHQDRRSSPRPTFSRISFSRTRSCERCS